MDAVLTNVTRTIAGADLTVQANSGTNLLTVASPDDFDWDNGGTVTIGATIGLDGVAVGGETKTYTINPTTRVLTLGSNLASTWPVGTFVAVSPPAIEYFGSVKAFPEDEEQTARVPPHLVPFVAPKGGGGIVNGSTFSPGTFVHADFGGEDLVVHSIYHDEPAYDGVYIKADTIEARHIKADAIDGKLITGATIRTSASNPKVQMDSTGLFLTESGGGTAIYLNPSGGLDLTADTGDDVNFSRQVRWIAAGTRIGYVTAWESSIADATWVKSQARSAGRLAEVNLYVDRPVGESQRGNIQLYVDNSSGAGVAKRVVGVSVDNDSGVGSKFYTIIDSSGFTGLITPSTGLAWTTPFTSPNLGIDTSVVPRLATSNTFTAQQNVAPTSDVVGFRVFRGTDSSPTADLTRWINAAGSTVQASIGAFGLGSFTGGVTTKVVSGAVSDANFALTPASGTIAIDTTNSKIYVRVGSTWKSVTVT